MAMRARDILVIVVATFALASCSGFPKRGFLTRYFQGSYLQDSVRDTNDFAGRRYQPAIDAYAAAVAPAGKRTAGTLRLQNNIPLAVQQSCALVAHQRASDASYQGFGDATQRDVYDNAYMDCTTWRAKH